MRVSITAADGFLHLPNNSRLSLRNRGNFSDRKRAVFLDRDGVLVEDIYFLKKPGDLRILSGVVEALGALADEFYLVVATNQSGIARGFFSEDDLLDIHSELLDRLAVRKVGVDALYYCPHLPDAPLRTYAADCDCRKPRPGMLVRAAADWGIDLGRSFLIGDKPRDVEAGSAAGARAVLLTAPGGQAPSGVFAAADLAQAVTWILNSQEKSGAYSGMVPLAEK